MNSDPSLGALNRRVLRACLVPQCSYPPYWPRHQRRLANRDWMLASYNRGQPSNPRRHPTCWASSQWSHTVSSTPCHGAWTSAPLSTHTPTECKRTAPQIETPICTRRTTSHQFIWQQQHTCGAVGGLPIGTRSGRTAPQDSAFSSPTSAPTPQEWSSKEEPGSGLTASAPVSDLSAPACANGVWPPLRSVSVVQKNKPSTMLSSNVQSIDLPMDCMAWRCWTMRQLNGCSTPAPRSSAAKQWFQQLAPKMKREWNLEIAVRSCALLCLQRQLAKLASWLLYC